MEPIFSLQKHLLDSHLRFKIQKILLILGKKFFNQLVVVAVVAFLPQDENLRFDNFKTGNMVLT
jgi:hypothetical protein